VNIRVKVLLPAGLLKLKETEKKAGEGKRSLCLGEVDVEHMRCLELEI
jgi:hypothetical protein